MTRTRVTADKKKKKKKKKKKEKKKGEFTQMMFDSRDSVFWT